MALHKQNGVRIAGISACVPKEVRYNKDIEFLSEKEKKLLIKTTGIAERRYAEEGICTSDLCEKAANSLIEKKGWKKEEIKLLVFVSQSPDYFLPATSIILQDKLGLKNDCVAFDICLGCSGYVYGLSVAMAMMKSMSIQKGLLLVGEVSSQGVMKLDKTTVPLFGDAGTATLLELTSSFTNESFYSLKSDGSGHDAIIMREGSGRTKSRPNKEFNEEDKYLKLDGQKVFDFTLKEVAPNIKSVLAFANTDVSEVDFFIWHQANKLINETIRRKLGIEKQKVLYSIQKYGNTSSASIPLTIVECLDSSTFQNETKKCVLSGFGVGLSWGSVLLNLSNTIIHPIIEFG